MIKRPAIILLILLALAIGSYFLIKNKSTQESGATPTPTESLLLQVSDHGNLTWLEIADNSIGKSITLKRFSDGAWIITEPNEASVDQGKVTAAETQLFSLRMLTTLETTTDLSMLGLSAPKYIITLKYEDGYEQTFQVGDKTPTSSGYYVNLDGNLSVISTYGIDAILELLNNPPYEATPIPSLELSTATPTS